MSQLLKALKQLESVQPPKVVRPAAVANDASKSRVAINDLFDEPAAIATTAVPEPAARVASADPAATAAAAQSTAQINLDALQVLLAEELAPLEPAPAPSATSTPQSRSRLAETPAAPARQLQSHDPLDSAIEDLAREILAARASSTSLAILIHAVGHVHGTSASTARLARTLSNLQPSNMLVIDTVADGTFSRILGVRSGAGILDVLAGTRRLADVLQATNASRVTFIGAGQPVTSLSQLQSQAAAVIAELRREFPLILIHSGGSNALLATELARCCDGTYLAVELGATAHRAATQIKVRFAKAGAQLLGCIAVDPNS